MNAMVHNRFGFCVPSLLTAFQHDRTRDEVIGLLREVAVSVGLSGSDANSLPTFIEEALAGDTTGAELQIRTWIDSRAAPSEMKGRFDARTSQICAQIQPFIRGNVIADIGCGDGLVALGLAGTRETLLVDVVNYLDSRVPFPLNLYSGQGPLPVERTADCSLLLTVLHHSEDPLSLWHETRRITTQRIIVIESVVPEIVAPDCEAQFIVAAFFDWFYNRVLHEDVPVPFNYNSVGGWRRLFDQDDWRTAHVIDLGRDQKLVPERHVLFVVDRMA